MANAKHESQFQLGKSSQVSDALDLLKGIVMEGLKHGFFDISLSCEIANGGKRKLVIRSGKSHIFTISEEEIPG